MIHILTKNKGKFDVAKKALAPMKVEQCFLDIPEIQADTSAEIAKTAAVAAAKRLNAPVIKEDHSLIITSLGIPGPYTQFIERKMPVEVLLKAMSNFADRTGHFELALCYAEPDGTSKEFSYRVPITVAKKAKGTSKGWDQILMLKGETRTFAEYPESERTVWDKNYVALKKVLG